MNRLTETQRIFIALGIFTLCAIGILFRPIFVTHTITPFDIENEFDQLQGSQQNASRNYLLSDSVHQFYPATTFLLTQLSQGVIPLWNPYQFGGTPFLQDPQVRPLELSRILALPFSFSTQAYLIASSFFLLLFAGFFTFLFCRSHRFSFLISVIGGVACMFSGPMLVWLQYPLAAGAIWLPFLLWCVNNLYEGKKSYAIWLAVGFFFLLLSGQPQMIVIIGMAVFFYGLARFLQTRHERGRLSISILLSLILGLGMSTFLLGPQFNYIQQSSTFESGRGRQDSATTFSIASIPSQATLFVKRAVTFGVLFVNPNQYGNPIDRNMRYPENNVLNNYNEISLYAGLLIAVFAAAALLLIKKRKAVQFWFMGALFSFGVSALLPGFALLTRLPILSKINTGRFRFVLVFCVMMLAVHALSWLSVKIQKKYWLWAGSAILVAVAFNGWIYFVHLNGSSTQSFDPAEANPIIDFLQKDSQQYRVIGLADSKNTFRTSLVPNEATALGLRDMRGSNPLYPNALEPLLGSLLTKHGAYVLSASLSSQHLADLTSIKYAICPKDSCESRVPQGWTQVATSGESALYQNPNPLPRAFVATTVESSYDTFATADPHFAAYLDVINATAPRVHDTPVQPATVLAESPNAITISAESATGGVLVLQDTYDEHWQVTVNGKKQELLRANFFGRGVFLPQGKSTIVFSYHLEHESTYVLISVVSLVALLGWSIWMRKQSVNKRPPVH